MMQCTFRMHQQKAQYEQALHKIRRTQAVWRGGLARTHKKMTIASIVQIQTTWRARNERVKYAIKKIRLVLLQSVVRGFLARAARTRMNNAAVDIQTQVRRHLCQQKLNQILSAAATINRVLRGMHARRQVSNAITNIVSGILENAVVSTIAADLELRALNAVVEKALDDFVG